MLDILKTISHIFKLKSLWSVSVAYTYLTNSNTELHLTSSTERHKPHLKYLGISSVYLLCCSS